MPQFHFCWKVPVLQAAAMMCGCMMIVLFLCGLDGREEVREAGRGVGQEGADVVHDVGGAGRALDHPPHEGGEREPAGDGLSAHLVTALMIRGATKTASTTSATV